MGSKCQIEETKMSVQPLICQECNREGVFDRMAPYPGKGDERTYGVGWRCPQCFKLSLDVCPVGPLVPSDALCLNCGAAYPAEVDNPTCGACGLARHGVAAALGVAVLPDDPLAAARDAFAKGLIRRGLAILNLALRRNPNLPEAWSVKCSFLDSLGFSQSKCTMLEGALAASAAPSLWVSQGFTLQQLGRHAEAVAAYRRYLEQDPAGPWAGVACCNQANSLARLGEEASADTLYRQAIALDPGRISHDLNYVRFLIDHRKWAEAQAVVEAALPKATTNSDLIVLLEDRAAVFAARDNGTEALAAADAALGRGSDSVRTHYLRGRALALLGRLDEARVEILRVLTLDPDNTEGKRALEMLDSVLLWSWPGPALELG
jgi:tetratricopeptide (TPR) repeat protein